MDPDTKDAIARMESRIDALRAEVESLRLEVAAMRSLWETRVDGPSE